MVYYLKQNVAMLDQISHQIASISPQVSIPSTPPPSFPSFNPLSSDIRVNVFWFMALVFSLTAALLAILVQQWVRDYMHVFQRYSDPLKSARLRQYLNEGSDGWYMPVVAEAVPGLLHVALFLFFVGLCDFTLNTNTTVGLSTTIPIGISGFLYIFTIFAPVIYPQSPYQSSFSGVIWYLIQKISARRYKDRGSGGALKSVDSNMADGQMQLAMEETDDRKGRDERAIRWLVSNMTEDAEMESFVMAIPGSFNGEWGVEVWKRVSGAIEDKNKIGGRNQRSRIQNVFGSIIHPVRTRTISSSHANTMAPLPALSLLNVHPHLTSTHIAGENTMRELSARVAHMLETCKNRNLFASDDLWRRRTRSCVETTASLVCCAGAELGQFGDMVKLLGDIAGDQKIRESSLVGKDQSFLMRWTCLSLVAIRPILRSYRLVTYQARSAWILLQRTTNDETSDAQALTRVPKIIETFDRASRCLNEILCELIWDRTEERVKEILHNHESRISELERINTEDYMYQMVDLEIRYVQRDIDRRTHGIITRQLPGVKSDDFDAEPAHFSQLAELFCDPHKLQFIFPVLKRICSVAHTFRNILEGQLDPDAFQETLDNLQESIFLSKRYANMLHRQVWRLQDLGDGGGLGFTVQLFFVTLKQLLSTSSPNESHSALYIGTLRAITSDWSKYKRSLGTQKLLLDLTVPDRGIFSDFDYPAYIVDEFLVLLGNILDGQRGPHIDDVEQLLSRRSRAVFGSLRGFYTKTLRVITRVRAPSS